MGPSRTAGAIVLLLVGALLGPAVAEGPAPRGAHRIGVIHHGGLFQVVVDGLRQGLRELGLVEGQTIVLDIRETRGDLRAVAEAARDLERSRVDLLYTVATTVTVAAKRATTHLPIVFYAGGDPVASGLVESLARPGGRLSGIHGLSTNLTAKRLEILKAMVPGLARVAVFYDPDNPQARESARRGAEAARQLGLQLVERHVRSVEALRRSLHEIDPREADAYCYTSDAMVVSQAPLIIDAARAKRWPTMFAEDSLAARGALASYGHSYHEIGRLSARFVQRILAGTSPRDLPVENFDRVDLVLNLRTAREIGLTIPPSVLARAYRVIE